MEKWCFLPLNSNVGKQLDFKTTSQSNPILHLLGFVFSSSKKEVLEIALSISKNDMTGGASKKAKKMKIYV
ncbi:hypothetical protein [Gillisia sp. Hel_I_86]|uniref:hypothetical protein n=1 Tax=Gillisia sp. Hel_I_86 TaxID=1249981 RepID=UPI0011A3B26B|nr:hypothetical protein [Gillisia sp. Hel_I_86]